MPFDQGTCLFAIIAFSAMIANRSPLTERHGQAHLMVTRPLKTLLGSPEQPKNNIQRGNTEEGSSALGVRVEEDSCGG